MEVIEFARKILEGGSIEDKLFAPDALEFSKSSEGYDLKVPARDERIKLTGEQIRFPRGHFHIIEKEGAGAS